MAKQKGHGGLFAQPPAGFYNRPELHLICGGTVQLDGCRRLTRFDGDSIAAEVRGWLITLYGNDLRIESLSGRRLLVGGRLARVEFQPLPRGKGKL